MRASNILGMAERPYDRDTFQESCPRVEDRAGNQGYNILHQNMVRFRWVEGEDGNMQPQSNSRQALGTFQVSQ